MTYAEDDLIMISALQHYSLLRAAVRPDPYRADLG